MVDALRAVQFAASNGEARRLIKGGGARVNDAAIKDEDHMIGVGDVSGDGVIKISAGKKRHALLRRT
jgi:tyrosyl-tRNA synthetase